MKKVILQKELRITGLFRQDEEEQWMYLDRADDFEDITLRSFLSRTAAIPFLAKETVFWPPFIQKAIPPWRRGEANHGPVVGRSSRPG